MTKPDYKLRCLEYAITEEEINLQDMLEFAVIKAEKKGFKKVNKLLKKLAKK